MSDEVPSAHEPMPDGAAGDIRGSPPTPSHRPPTPTAALRLSPSIPDHELIRRIGAGAYGEVWLARNTLGTYRAVKVVYRSDFDSDRPYDREFEGIRKAEPVSRTHESQVDILHVGRGEGYFYYVMELADDVNAERGMQNAEFPEGQRSSAPRSALRVSSSHQPVPRSALPVPSSYIPRTLKHDLQTRSRLPPAECVEIGLALATALAHLHRHGLVHRDVKPSNIIFIGGVPKLADIGLVTDADTTFSYVGTEGYVAPEGPGSPQADLYSLGKALYEISTGKDRKEYPALPPELRALPDSGRLVELNAVILKACSRDPRERYSSAEALRADLELLQRGRSVRQQRARQRRWALVRTAGVAAATLAMLTLFGALLFSTLRHRLRTIPLAQPEPVSIFVLPFRYSAPQGEPLDETERGLWLSGRITDAFIDGLALIPGVSTGPRKSDWLRFEEDEVRRNVARTNATRYLLSGRVGRANDLFRLELRLYGRDGDAPFWAESFEGATNDPIALERRALEPISKSLGLELDTDVRQRIEQVWTRNLEAYRWFLQARRHHRATTASDYREAMTCFGRALELDPKYVTAHEAYIEMFREFFDSRSPAEVWETLAERSRRVLELDDTSFVASMRLLNKMILYDRDWEQGVPEFERQTNIWPEVIDWSIICRWLGRTNESRLYHERDKQSRPVNAITRRRTLEHATYGELIWGNYDEAFRFARRCLEEVPDSPNYGQYLLGRCYLATGQYPQAVDAFLQVGAIWPSPELDGRLGWAYARMGDRAKALEYLARLEQGERAGNADPYFQAWVHAALGDTHQALQALERAMNFKSEMIVHTEFGGLRTDRAWDDLRDDPRFDELCQRVGMGKGQWPK